MRRQVEGASRFEVMGTCPETGRAVPLKIRVTNRGNRETLQVENSHYACAACGGEHVIVKQDAVLREADAGS